MMVLLLALLLAAAAWAGGVQTENKGAPEIKVPGGSRGDVAFPHQRHQNTLGDCAVCHELFPQKAGAIVELKASGELKAKQVMYKLCINCHNDRKKAGESYGPTSSCSGCHSRGEGS